MKLSIMQFEWDKAKELHNIAKHGVAFKEALSAFDDPRRIILQDIKHSHVEKRFYCFGMVDGKVMTVRFTYRRSNIRIIGAAYWRDGRGFYEKTHNV